MSQFKAIIAVVTLLFCTGLQAKVETSATSSNQSSAAVMAKVNVNTADLEQLTSIKGIGKVTAMAILEYRKKHGAFETIEDLTLVRGIGEKLLLKLTPQVVI